MNLLLNIDVSDLAQAERFFVDAFGLAPARRLGESVLELTGAAVPVYLLETKGGSEGAPGSPRDFGRHWTPLHVDVVVDDVEAALARALDAGATQEGDLREADWGRLVRVVDPFGHGWCLLQFSSLGYDAIAR